MFARTSYRAMQILIIGAVIVGYATPIANLLGMAI